MAPSTYGEIMAANIRAARSRADIGQARLAARMRALGFTQWVPQTVSKSERSDRRLLAEEIAGLAVALETTIRYLMTPLDEDKLVELQPDGPAVAVSTIRMSAEGRNDGAVRWDGDKPVFADGTRAWWGTRHDDPALREG
jgi:transcriptional regulator with XRE-family HTH domain